MGDYELFGVPIPTWLGDYLAEVLQPSWLVRLAWIVCGLALSLAAWALGFYLTYT